MKVGKEIPYICGQSTKTSFKDTTANCNCYPKNDNK